MIWKVSMHPRMDSPFPGKSFTSSGLSPFVTWARQYFAQRIEIGFAKGGTGKIEAGDLLKEGRGVCYARPNGFCRGFVGVKFRVIGYANH
jgi:hypothetical protein